MGIRCICGHVTYSIRSQAESAFFPPDIARRVENAPTGIIQ
ncbi:hypothetical protein HMPREF0620_1631 [Parascardovia denticolens DSM 10105 = JCM 12538]|uniref:Uncharacterized protein n=1 Tax=Parascardovia denticolens DSM 10105 = JCM 12538 TaxID=864564 RepID=E6K2F8_PARDN|nr:hypothetical protein HMPREF0620_1631 [Parascardovia denticolens DSM 10105 = JCM 12538]